MVSDRALYTISLNYTLHIIRQNNNNVNKSTHIPYTFSSKHQAVKQMIKSTFHKCVSNVIAVTNPTQYTTIDKHTVKVQNTLKKKL